MTRAACVVAAISMLLLGCGNASRTYDVEVRKERICRTFDPQPEACADTTTPTLRISVTIEDRLDGKAIIYGRSDTSEERSYMATVTKTGHYVVDETTSASDSTTLCATTTRTTLSLDVTDANLTGGEEFKVEEGRKCNEFNQRRVTRRLREWAGSAAK